MKIAKIKGEVPLIGDVKVSGASDSAVALIFASMFFSEPIVLENVPETLYIKRCLEIVTTLGGSYTKVAPGRFLINCSGLSSFEVPFNEGKALHMIFYTAGPLLYRFGKAIIPKPLNFTKKQIEEYKQIWESIGVEVFEDDRFLVLRSGELGPCVIKIAEKNYTQTVFSILSSIFLSGETVIFSPSQKYEVHDVIKFFNEQDPLITTDENGSLKIKGKSTFKGITFQIQPSTTEAVFFATASILTKGNITIKNLEREPFLSFLNVLSKIGCGFEFSSNDLKVWSAGERKLAPVDISTSPAPGFLNAWHGFVLPIFSLIDGTSTILLNDFDCTFEYATELKRIGVNAKLVTNALDTDINTNQVKFEVTGKTPLIGTKVSVPDVYSSGFLLCTCLGASGVSEVYGLEKIEFKYDNIFEKLSNLGAELELVEEHDN